jgi:hypothetical protein
MYGQEVGIDEASKLAQLRPLVRRPAEQFLTIASVLFSALYLIVTSYVPRWRRISHLPAGLRKYGGLGLSIGPILVAALSPIFGMPLGNSGIFEAVALRFGDVMRANPLPVGGLILALLGAGYWTAQRLFSELEPDSAPMPSGRKSWGRGGLFGV